MTLRDLTKRQLYNLQRRCEKERRVWSKKPPETAMNSIDQSIWRAAYDRGLRAGLELQPTLEAQKMREAIEAAAREAAQAICARIPHSFGFNWREFQPIIAEHFEPTIAALQTTRAECERQYQEQAQKVLGEMHRNDVLRSENEIVAQQARQAVIGRANKSGEGEQPPSRERGAAVKTP